MSTNEITHIIIYIGSSYLGNLGSGAYAATIERWNKDRPPLIDKVSDISNTMTSCNQMGMSAAIEALRHLREKHTGSLNVPITLVCNSKYVIDGMNKWLKRWKNNGWKTTSKTQVENYKLWLQLDETSTGLSLSWKWEQGHKVNQAKKAAHALAKKELDKFRDT
ncbi:RNase H family protein [Pseudochrobactrum lubricantis]|uniref:RNase H family protein n=1 Tax=Pseudochrobactrum lubricantis TaxID=558172 RepID=UPI0035D5D501